MSQLSEYFSEPNAFTAMIFEKLKDHPKRIVFPEGEDVRIVRVAARMVEMEIGVPILLGDESRIISLFEKEGLSLDFVRIINPSKSSDLSLFAKRLEKIERYRGLSLTNATETVTKPHRYAAMMLQYSHCDAVVGGNQVIPGLFYRSLLQMVKPLANVPRVFSAAVVVGDHLDHLGSEGILFLADTGMNPAPLTTELASFAVETGKVARHYLGRRPRVVLLSHSTKGSSNADSARRMEAATALAKSQVSDLDIEIDGELQADVALDPLAAEVKLPEAERHGSADVLVFPNLDASHISMKLLQHVAGAQIYGHLVMGLTRPAAQVPRTATEEMILGTAAAVGLEAVKTHELYAVGEITW